MKLITQGIVLKRQPYRETSILCQCLSEDYGKITVIASGCYAEKSQFTGFIEPFNLLNFELHRSPKSEICNLQNAQLVGGYLQNVDYQTNLLINAAGELLLQLAFSDADGEDFFNLLNSYCLYIRQTKHQPYLVFLRFAFRVFALLGIPLKIGCSQCEKKDLSCYTLRSNGFLCCSCSSLSTKKQRLDNSSSDNYIRVAESRREYTSPSVVLSSETAKIIENIYQVDAIGSALLTPSFVDETKEIILLHLNSSFHKPFRLNSLKDLRV